MRDFRAELRRRLAAARLEPTRAAEIVDEIAQHLEDRQAELEAAGQAPDAAAESALAELDDNAVLARELRRVEPVATEPLVPGAPRRGLVADLVHDVRYGLRALRKSPAFTAVTVASLALGIGANTAIFQLLAAIHLRTLPVFEPGELAVVHVDKNHWGKGDFSGWHPDLTNPLWEQLRAQQRGFARIAAWGDQTFNLAPSGEARWARGFFVSGAFFDVLGVQPFLGRMLHDADDRRGCATASAVVSHGFWQRELGGDPGVVGRRLTLDGHAVEVVGVTPPSFFGPEIGRTFDVAVPLCYEAVIAGEDSRLDVRYSFWLSAIGRLAPGWTVEKAGAQLSAIGPALLGATIPADYTPDDVTHYLAYRMGAAPAATGVSPLRQRYTTPLYFLAAIAGLVLLIACANLANLLLARGAARERELAVRLAVGASRARLVRQLLTESLLLAVLGAAAALMLGRWLGELLLALLSTRDRTLVLGLDPDLRVLGFTAGLAALTCVLFGLVPALRASRADVGLVLKAHGGAAGHERLGLRRILVVTQVALSFVLLVGALLFTRSFRNLVQEPTGFREDGIVVMSVDFAALGLEPAQRLPFDGRVLEAVRATPGVTAAASATIVPVRGNGWNDPVWMDGVAGADHVIADCNRVSAGWFQTVGTPLLAGRDFGAADSRAAPPVAIVNRAFAGRLTAGASPVGRRLRIAAGPDVPEQSYEIVGLVGDTKYRNLHDELGPIVYLAASQDPKPALDLALLVRSPLPPAELTGGLKRALADVAPAATVDFEVWADRIAESAIRDRLMALLSSFFGFLAALLAGIGLYGVVATSVARRTHEIGIRIALGADRTRIAGMILGEAVRLLGGGLVVGVGLALAVTRTARALLYGLAPEDPVTLALAVAVMAALTCVASWVPARRAARVDPMMALREE
jgi:predicted permease